MPATPSSPRTSLGETTTPVKPSSSPPSRRFSEAAERRRHCPAVSIRLSGLLPPLLLALGVPSSRSSPRRSLYIATAGRRCSPSSASAGSVPSVDARGKTLPGACPVAHHQARHIPAATPTIHRNRAPSSIPHRPNRPLFLLFAAHAAGARLSATTEADEAPTAPRWRPRGSRARSSVSRARSGHGENLPRSGFCVESQSSPWNNLQTFRNCRKAPSFQIQITLSIQIQI